MKNLYKHSILFMIGGVSYYIIEVLFRGYSHWTMAVLGGILFVLIGLINEDLAWDTPLLLQGMIGALFVTVFEFFAGCIINLILGWNVWDYSDVPFNIMGQICLPFTILWFFVSILAILLDDFLRYWLFGEEKPHYKLL